MTDRVAALITNYNMPERADALYEHIDRHSAWPTDIYLIDNASDLQEPAVNTNVWIKPNNKQTTGGWLEGLKHTKKQGEYFAYLFLITSADFPATTGDPISPLAELLQKNRNAVGVHPALTIDSTTSWIHLITRGGSEPRRTWFIDNICSMYRADWFDSIGWFDPELRYAWGIDLETCWIARSQQKELYVHEGVQIRKVTDIAYRMERMRMSADERSHLAGQNMAIILGRKYGPEWWKRMTEENVEDAWR
jgi:GT2 family glycosyltransferase